MSVQNEIAKLGNGVGSLYLTDINNAIVATVPNNKEGKKTVQLAVVNSAPISSEVAATATIHLTGGAGTITDITVNSISVFDTATAITGGSTTLLASAAALAINSYVSTPDYSAVASGAYIYITAAKGAGSIANGSVVAVSITGTLTWTASTLDGGTNTADVIDVKTGLKVWLNTAPTAPQGDLTGATDVTVQMVQRSITSASIIKTAGTVAGLISPVRQHLFTFVNVETESMAASDTIQFIQTEGYNDGDFLFIRGVDSSRVSTIADTSGISGTMNIKLANGASFLTGGLDSLIVLQYFNVAGQAKWYESFRSPGIAMSVATMRGVSIPQPVNGTRINAMTTGGGTVNLTPGTDKGYQIITGTGTLAASWVYQGAGTPLDADRFIIDYRGTFTKGANDITLFGIALTATQALEGNVFVIATYDAVLGAYRAVISKTVNGEDLVDSVQLATKEPGLGLPAADGYTLSSTALGVRSWVAIDDSVIVANTVFVSKNGDDATGLVERLDKPFLNINSAVSAALAAYPTRTFTSRIKIIVESGNYTEAIYLYDFIDFDLGNSVITSPSGGSCILNANLAFTPLSFGYNCIIYGNAILTGSNASNNPPVYIDGVNSVGIRVLLMCNAIYSSEINTIKTRTGYLKIVCDLIYNSSITEFTTGSSTLSASCISISTNVSYQSGGSPTIEIVGAKICMNQGGSWKGAINFQNGLLASYNTNRCKLLLTDCEVGSWSTDEPAIYCNYGAPGGTNIGIADVTLRNTSIYSDGVLESISNLDLNNTGSSIYVYVYNSSVRIAPVSVTTWGGFTTQKVSTVTVSTDVLFNQGELI